MIRPFRAIATLASLAALPVRSLLWRCSAIEERYLIPAWAPFAGLRYAMERAELEALVLDTS